MRAIKLFFKWAYKDFWIFLISFAFLFLQSYLLSLTPVLVGKIFGILEGATDSTLPAFFEIFFKGSMAVQIIIAAVLFFALSIISYLVGQLYYFLLDVFSVKFAGRARADYYKKIQSAPYEKYIEFESSDLLARCLYSTDNIIGCFKDNVVPFVEKIINLCFSLAQMFLIFKTAAYLTGSLSVVGIIIFLIFVVKCARIITKEEEAKSKMMNNIKEAYTNIRTIKMFNFQEYTLAKSYEINNEFAVVQKKWYDFRNVYRNICLYPLMYIKILSFFLLCFFAIFNLKILSTSNAIALVGLFWSIDKYDTSLQDNILYIPKTFVSFNRIADFYDSINSNLDKNNYRCLRPEISGLIEFKNVSLKIEERSVLKNFNLIINPNENVLLKSSSGEQQSAILLLLIKFVENYQGEILLDGVNIKDIDTNHLREKVCMVEERPYVFNNTSEKVLFADKKIKTDDIKSEAVKNLVLQKKNSTKKELKSKKAIIEKLKYYAESDCKIILLDNILFSISSKELNEILETPELKEKTVIITNNFPSYKINVDKEISINNRQKVTKGQ